MIKLANSKSLDGDLYPMMQNQNIALCKKVIKTLSGT
jgi:hypothetical protein